MGKALQRGGNSHQRAIERARSTKSAIPLSANLDESLRAILEDSVKSANSLSLGDSLTIIGLAIAILMWILVPTILEKASGILVSAGLSLYLCYKCHWVRNWQKNNKHALAAITTVGILAGGGCQLWYQWNGARQSTQPITTGQQREELAQQSHLAAPKPRDLPKQHRRTAQPKSLPQTPTLPEQPLVNILSGGANASFNDDTLICGNETAPSVQSDAPGTKFSDHTRIERKCPVEAPVKPSNSIQVPHYSRARGMILDGITIKNGGNREMGMASVYIGDEAEGAQVNNLAICGSHGTSLLVDAKNTEFNQANISAECPNDPAKIKPPQ